MAVQSPFQRNIRRVGGGHSFLRDVYAALLQARWSTVLGVFAVSFVLVNFAFAGLYLTAGNAIANARPGSFEDAFSFSVQTLSTVGYGQFHPLPPVGHILAAAESFVGILLIAVATGICFNKFARPKAGMLFAQRAVVGPHNGRRCLMLRVANTRGGDIVEASIRLTAVKSETTTEGHKMRRLHDLKLERATTPLLALSWLVIHRIDEESPIAGITSARMRDENILVIVNITGLDGVFVQTVYATATYDHTRVVFDAQFEDMITPGPDGAFTIDLRKLHETKPAARS